MIKLSLKGDRMRLIGLPGVIVSYWLCSRLQELSAGRTFILAYQFNDELCIESDAFL